MYIHSIRISVKSLKKYCISGNTDSTFSSQSSTQQSDTSTAGCNQSSSLEPNFSSVSSSSSVPSDIASSPQEQPVQPVLNAYPCTKFGDRERCFNSNWYSKYEWLEYSIVKDAAFCYPCRFFAHGSRAEDRFLTHGYKDWKHATGQGGSFLKHDRSKHHQEALMNWMEYRIRGKL